MINENYGEVDDQIAEVSNDYSPIKQDRYQSQRSESHGSKASKKSSGSKGSKMALPELVDFEQVVTGKKSLRSKGGLH